MTFTEKDVLLKLLMNIMTVQSVMPTDKAWAESCTASGIFGGVNVRVAFFDPLEAALPLIIVYGPSWEVQFRLPKHFPDHPRISSRPVRIGQQTNFFAKVGIDAHNTQIFAPKVEGDISGFQKDLLYVMMAL